MHRLTCIELSIFECFITRVKTVARESNCQKSLNGSLIIARDSTGTYKEISRGSNKTTDFQACVKCLRTDIHDNSRYELSARFMPSKKRLCGLTQNGARLACATQYCFMFVSKITFSPRVPNRLARYALILLRALASNILYWFTMAALICIMLTNFASSHSIINYVNINLDSSRFFSCIKFLSILQYNYSCKIFILNIYDHRLHLCR